MAPPFDPQGFLKTTGISGVYVPDLPISRLGAEVYALLEPYAEGDQLAGYPLRGLVEAMTKTFVDIDEIVRDSPAGDPGWSAIMDATRCPSEGLAWLGQLVGVQLNVGDTVQMSRDRISGAAGIRRGTVQQLTLAAQRLLTGNKTVLITERTSDAWHFSVRTRTTETPSSAAVLAALIAQKPAGLIMDYNTFAGILYAETTAAFATYAATTAAKATYALRSV